MNLLETILNVSDHPIHDLLFLRCDRAGCGVIFSSSSHVLETTAFSNWSYGICYGIIMFRGRKIRSVKSGEGRKGKTTVSALYLPWKISFLLFFSLSQTLLFLKKQDGIEKASYFIHSSFSATINVNSCNSVSSTLPFQFLTTVTNQGHQR